MSWQQELSNQPTNHLVKSRRVESLWSKILKFLANADHMDTQPQKANKSENIIPTCPGCCPGMAALTLMVVPRVPKAGGAILGAKGGRVNTTLAWGWGPE